METKTTIDKSKWGNGPWQSEPDHANFEHAGLPCMIHRGRAGAWCGYVAVDENHPAFGIHYSEIYVDIHGGLSYSDHCQGELCHVPKPGQPDNVWWLGFDCLHSGDVAPAYNSFAPSSSVYDSYKDLEFIVSETKQLAEQLAKV